jgi:hypothetical protein
VSGAVAEGVGTNSREAVSVSVRSKLEGVMDSVFVPRLKVDVEVILLD